MSWLTLLMMIPLLAASAQAGSALEEAQNKRSRAFNDFYKKYKASKRTPEDAKVIGDQTIGPSSSAASRAIAVERQQAYKHSGIGVMSQSEADAAVQRMQDEAEAAENEAEEGGEAGDTKTADAKGADGKPAATGKLADGSGAGAPGSGPYGEIKKPAAPETVIDGKGIPKEITFGGGKKKR